MKLTGKIIIIIFLSGICSNGVFAQDTLNLSHRKEKKYTLTPIRATMYAAALPGMGQIYNRKYWKVPVVYAGFGALGYAVVHNASNYSRNIEAYQDFTDDIPETNSYTSLYWLENVDPSLYDPVLYPLDYQATYKTWVEDNLLSSIAYYRKYRDLSYIGIAAWYLVTIIDANVDASLFDYDINNNLDVSILPVAMTARGMMPGFSISLVKTF